MGVQQSRHHPDGNRRRRPVGDDNADGQIKIEEILAAVAAVATSLTGGAGSFG